MSNEQEDWPAFTEEELEEIVRKGVRDGILSAFMWIGLGPSVVIIIYLAYHYLD
jgi:hypothetical protein